MKEFSVIVNEVKTKIDTACRRAGRNPDEVEIIAVTKTHGAEVVKEAWDAGLRIVGENKYSISRLELKDAVGGFDSVEGLSLAKEFLQGQEESL